MGGGLAANVRKDIGKGNVGLVAVGAEREADRVGPQGLRLDGGSV